MSYTISSCEVRSHSSNGGIFVLLFGEKEGGSRQNPQRREQRAARTVLRRLTRSPTTRMTIWTQTDRCASREPPVVAEPTTQACQQRSTASATPGSLL